MQLLKDVLELERRDTGRWTIRPVDDELSLEKGFYCFVRALQLLKSRNDGVILVRWWGAAGWDARSRSGGARGRADQRPRRCS